MVLFFLPVLLNQPKILYSILSNYFTQHHECFLFVLMGQSKTLYSVLASCFEKEKDMTVLFQSEMVYDFVMIVLGLFFASDTS